MEILQSAKVQEAVCVEHDHHIKQPSRIGFSIGCPNVEPTRIAHHTHEATAGGDSRNDRFSSTRVSVFFFEENPVFEIPSLPHLLMVLVIFALLFGAKRVPEIAGSLGKGIKEFKQNIRDDAPEVSQDFTLNDRPSESARSVDYRRDEPARPEPKRLID